MKKPVNTEFYGLLIWNEIKFVGTTKRTNSFYLFENQSITTIGNFSSPFCNCKKNYNIFSITKVTKSLRDNLNPDKIFLLAIYFFMAFSIT